MVRRGLRRLPPFKDYLFRAAALLSITSVALAFVIVTYRPPAPNHRQGEQTETNQESIESKNFGERLLDDPTAFFTMVLAGLTFVLAGVSSFQIYFLLSADRTTRLAARAAVKSAEVAARTVRSIEDTAERQLRAYVSITKVEFRNLEGVAEFWIAYRNSGQAPAYDLQSRSVVRYTPYPVDENFDNFEGVLGSLATLGPDSTQHFMKPGLRQLTFDEIGELRSGTAAIYLYGVLTYKDCFKKERFTEFRHIVGGYIGISSHNSMGICQEGNRSN